ncbi:MAG: hypothetical protein PVJ21_09030 [Anaerolineales bacterium]|jgi:hypothetical protein
MKIFNFDLEVGEKDEPFGSVKAIIARVLQLDNKAEVNAVYIHPGEHVRVQQLMTQQMFLLVDGAGWVKDVSGKKKPVKQGQAIFWGESELPESGAESGMTAVIIGNIDIDPVKLMPLLQEDKS